MKLDFIFSAPLNINQQTYFLIFFRNFMIESRINK